MARLAYQRGLEALRKGNVASARADFEEAVRRRPSHAEAQAALGWVLAQQGELAPAVTRLKAALRLKPDLLTARMELAGILLQQGNPDEAEREARLAVKGGPA